MKTISNEYKEKLRALGKEIDSIITIGETELTSEQINSANLHYEGNILKSVMKQLDLVLVDPLEKGVELNYKFGIKVNDEYEYIDYGTFIVYQCDKLEDTDTYQIKCYDKMLYSMTDYEDLNITYPITIKNYLQAICTKLGLTLKDDDFANQDREIQQELYLDSDGNSLGYKFRDVLDEIAQATGSTICINDDDELEVRYINEAVKESESLSGTSFELESEEGPLNIDELEGETTQETTTGKNLVPFTNQDFTLKNVRYYVQDGSLYLNGTSTGETSSISQEFKDNLSFTLPAGTYYASCGSNGRSYYLYNKTTNTPIFSNPNYVSGGTTRSFTLNEETTLYIGFYVYQNTFNNVNNEIMISTSSGSYEPYTYGATPNPNYPQDIHVVSGDNTIDICGKNLVGTTNVSSTTTNGITYSITGDTITINGTATANTTIMTTTNFALNQNTTYNLSFITVNGTKDSTFMGLRFRKNGSQVAFIQTNTTTSKSMDLTNIDDVQLYIISGTVFNNYSFKFQLEKGNTATTYEPYIGNSYPISLGTIELCKIGTYQDYIYKGVGYNLYNKNANETGTISQTDGQTISPNSTIYHTPYIAVETNITYNATCNTSGLTIRYFTYDSNHNYIGTGLMPFPWTIPSGVAYVRLQFNVSFDNDLMFFKGTSLPYEPYNAKDKWYLHKEIGKHTILADDVDKFLNTLTNSKEARINQSILGCVVGYNGKLYSNRFRKITNTWGNDTIGIMSGAGNPITQIAFRIPSSSDKTWFTNNETILYFPLANPTTTEITNNTYPELYSQLKAIEKARTLEGLTYIDSSVPISFEYIKEYETIDEEMVKNTRASFEDVYGPINSIVLSRSADSDNVYLQDEQSIEENGLHELKISDNQILNGNDRSDYLPELLDRLDGLMYNLNDYESIGITYLDLCDRYKVSLRGNKYTCIMFNDEIEVNNGLNEIIYTEMPQETQTDYSKADKTDRRINQTTLIVDKQQGIIESLVEKVVDVSKEISGTGSITLENAHAGNLHYLSIKGNISQLFPNNNIKPSNTRLPIGPTLLIDSTEYTLDIDRLRYVNNTLCDEFIYEDGECYIIRRVDSNNNALANEVIEPRQGIILQVEESSTISLKSFNNAIFKCEYLLENVYTDNFASQVDVKSSITQAENMINEKVEAIADEDGNITSASIILAINKDESSAEIQADKIKLEGYTTINDGFSVDLEGNMKAKSGDVGGWKINEKGLDNGTQHIYNNGYSNIYTYADMVTIRNYLLGNIDLTQNDIIHYDLNGDGVVDLTDYLLMRKMILGEDE